MFLQSEVDVIKPVSDGVEPAVKQKIIRLILALFPSARIYLYGSRARGNFHEHSDIDLAIQNTEEAARSRSW